MLMNIQTSIVQAIKVSLTFDDNRTKEFEIAVGDLYAVEFNKNGQRKRIEGKVIRVSASDTVNSKAWSIVIDGSLDFSGQVERFSPNQILDLELIQKANTALYVATTRDENHITNIRLVNGVFQVSTDGGYSYVTPKNYVEFEPPAPIHNCDCNKPIMTYIETGSSASDSYSTKESSCKCHNTSGKEEFYDGIEDESY